MFCNWIEGIEQPSQCKHFQAGESNKEKNEKWIAFEFTVFYAEVKLVSDEKIENSSVKVVRKMIMCWLNWECDFNRVHKWMVDNFGNWSWTEVNTKVQFISNLVSMDVALVDQTFIIQKVCLIKFPSKFADLIQGIIQDWEVQSDQKYKKSLDIS